MSRRIKILLSTAIAIIIGLMNYFSVQYFVQRGINPVEVAYTKVEIPPNTKITKEMVVTRTVPNDGVPPNAIKNPKSIIGKYTVNGYGLAENSLLYKKNVLAANEMPNSAVLKLNKGEYSFPLLVDLETSMGNSILPETRVDLFFRGEIEVQEMVDGKEKTVKKPIYGNLAQNVRVTSVKSTDATNVFSEEDLTGQKENGEARPVAKIYTFAVNSELNEILNKASLLGEIRPVAKGETDEEMKKGEIDMIKWIDEQSVKYNKKEEKK